MKQLDAEYILVFQEFAAILQESLINDLNTIDKALRVANWLSFVLPSSVVHKMVSGIKNAIPENIDFENTRINWNIATTYAIDEYFNTCNNSLIHNPDVYPSLMAWYDALSLCETINDIITNLPTDPKDARAIIQAIKRNLL